MGKELDFGQLIQVLRRHLLLIILCASLCGAAAFIISAFMLTPQYSARASMYVYNERSREDAVTSADLSTSQQLVETYIVVLTSNTVMDKVCDKLGGSYIAEEIREMLSASAISETEAFQIIVTHPEPAVAQKIANTIVQVAPEEIIRVVKAGSVEVIDYAKLPEEPSFPNVFRNTLVGTLLGLVLSVIIALLRFLSDTVVHSEEELTTEFTIPIIGAIPTITTNENGGRY